jgi:hypothetical protein
MARDSLDNRLSLGAITRIVEKFRCDPKAIVEMMLAWLRGKTIGQNRTRFDELAAPMLGIPSAA